MQVMEPSERKASEGHPPPEASIPAPILLDRELRGTLAVEVYQQIRQSPGITQAQIAERLACKERTVSRNIRKLVDKGYLVIGESGGGAGRPNVYSFPPIGLAS
jgi:DNA-binding NarL/FixJ family response regulator